MEIQDEANKRAEMICTLLQRFPAAASMLFAAMMDSVDGSPRVDLIIPWIFEEPLPATNESRSLS